MTVDVGFYHLTRQPLAEVLPRLVERAREAGLRVLVQAPDADALKALDDALWTWDKTSFLAHGTEAPEVQPVFLSLDAANANAAQMLILCGTPLPDDLSGWQRVATLFEDGSEAQGRARGEWKALAGREGLTRAYWQQDERGRWTRAA